MQLSLPPERHRRLGRFGTRGPARCSAPARPGPRIPGPGGPGRNIRRPPRRPARPGGSPARAWPASRRRARSNRMTRAAALGVRPISRLNRARRYRSLQPVSAASRDTVSRPPERSSACQACVTSGLTAALPPARSAASRARPPSTSSSAANRPGQVRHSCSRWRTRPASGPSTSLPSRSKLASSPAGRPSRARAPSGLRYTWIPDWRPSCVISAGAVCRPPTRVSYRPAG